MSPFFRLAGGGCLLAFSSHHNDISAHTAYSPRRTTVDNGCLSSSLLLSTSQDGEIGQFRLQQDVEDLPTTEPLSSLTKESLYCFRSPDDVTAGACTVECKRMDRQPLGWGLPNGTTVDNQDLRRRCFAFTTRALPGQKYEGPIVVHVREIPFSYGKLGGSVWMASIALSQYLSMNPSLVQSKRILELGSGVGLLGITISKLGAAHITMSEYGSEEGVIDGPIPLCNGDKRLMPSALLTNLHFNANLNLQQGNFSIQHIDWYDYLSEEISVQGNHSLYDLIVGSDLINWEDDIDALIATLQHFMKNHETKALLSSQIQNRKGLPLFLKRLQEKFQHVETEEYYVQHYETHPILLIKISC